LNKTRRSILMVNFWSQKTSINFPKNKSWKNSHQAFLSLINRKIYPLSQKLRTKIKVLKPSRSKMNHYSKLMDLPILLQEVRVIIQRKCVKKSEELNQRYRQSIVWFNLHLEIINKGKVSMISLLFLIVVKLM